MVVVKIVRKIWILGIVDGFDMNLKRKGGVKDDSKALWSE